MPHPQHYELFGIVKFSLSYLQDTNGLQHQVWYDDESSLIYKYMLAIMSGLRGVGMWTANDLDYSDTAKGKLQRERMWSILP